MEALIDPHIATWPNDQACLLAGRCQACSATVFPAPEACPRCGGVAIEVVDLPRRGSIWTYTVQGFPPPKPPYVGPASIEDFRPFAVAYVDLGPVLVEGPVAGDPDAVHIGDEVDVAFEVIGADSDGTNLVSFVFRRLEGEGDG